MRKHRTVLTLQQKRVIAFAYDFGAASAEELAAWSCVALGSIYRIVRNHRDHCLSLPLKKQNAASHL
jgi:hypothetical protein